MALDILLIDDEPDIRLALAEELEAVGHRVTSASDGAAALEQLQGRVFDLVITDVRLPKVDGMSILRRVRSEAPRTGVILITAYGDISDAVTAVREGAVDYLTKPFDIDALIALVHRIDVTRCADAPAAGDASADGSGKIRIIGRTPAMVHLRDRIATLADNDAPVMITGESGTGKELVARSLHEQGRRRRGPFVAVNCAAFPETLIEAELFGHERGAFTGAVAKRLGRFKAADGGTLFLDEVPEIPLPVQAKLLRVLQDCAVDPLGSDSSVSFDVRIISATHGDLRENIAKGRFRADLYYRLNVLDISIPPLRDRRGDLPVLAEAFLRKYASAANGPPRILPRAWAALYEHPFPGNVRELEHAIQHAVVMAQGQPIDLQHLPRDIHGRVKDAQTGGELESLRPLSEVLREIERQYLIQVLDRTHGGRTDAARILGISRKSLWEKLRSHGIDGGNGD